ncbi:MAG TPA: T9SS type A sorting domain-containing protein [Saprospiraceae bacterium]|nr:T9SS type A sorting domain-containing protein [Saprospiraceae bacterium]
MAVNALPKPVLDTLESHWGAHCSGAGALARSVLYQNGRRLYADCNGTEERDTPGGKIRKSANEEHGNQITISPNPANQTVQITRSTGVIGAQLRIIGLTGTLEEFTIPQGQNSTTLSVSHLPNGMYIVTLVEEGKIAARQKLMILH